MSAPRSAPESRSPIACRSVSPARWPSVSLTILKCVQVEEHQAIRASCSRRRRSACVMRSRNSAVGEAGDGIVEGLVRELPLELLALGDVAEVEHDPGDGRGAEQVADERLGVHDVAVAVAHAELDEVGGGRRSASAGRRSRRGRARGRPPRSAPPGRCRRGRARRGRGCSRPRGSRSGSSASRSARASRRRSAGRARGTAPRPRPAAGPRSARHSRGRARPGAPATRGPRRWRGRVRRPPARGALRAHRARRSAGRPRAARGRRRRARSARRAAQRGVPRDGRMRRPAARAPAAGPAPSRAVRRRPGGCGRRARSRGNAAVEPGPASDSEAASAASTISCGLVAVTSEAPASRSVRSPIKAVASCALTRIVIRSTARVNSTIAPIGATSEPSASSRTDCTIWVIGAEGREPDDGQATARRPAVPAWVVSATVAIDGCRAEAPQRRSKTIQPTSSHPPGS